MNKSLFSSAQSVRRWVVALWSLAISTLSISAHPGHELTAYGPTHIVTSPYHLAVLAVAGAVIWGCARFIRHRLSRRALQVAGVLMIGCAALLSISR